MEALKPEVRDCMIREYFDSLSADEKRQIISRIEVDPSEVVDGVLSQLAGGSWQRMAQVRLRQDVYIEDLPKAAEEIVAAIRERSS